MVLRDAALEASWVGSLRYECFWARFCAVAAVGRAELGHAAKDVRNGAGAGRPEDRAVRARDCDRRRAPCNILPPTDPFCGGRMPTEDRTTISHEPTPETVERIQTEDDRFGREATVSPMPYSRMPAFSANETIVLIRPMRSIRSCAVSFVVCPAADA